MTSQANMEVLPNPEEDYRSFTRNTTQRASTGTLKQPRLPGSDRLSKFTRSTENLHTAANPHRRLTGSSSAGFASAGRCSPTYHHHTQSKRRPVIPISKTTSRVLNNTNIDLSANTIEFIRNETSRLSTLCRKYATENQSSSNSITDDSAVEWSRSSSDQSLQECSNRLNASHDEGLAMTPPVIKVQSPDDSDNNNKTTAKNPAFASIRGNRLRMRANKVFSSSQRHSVSSGTDDEAWVETSAPKQ